MKLSSSEKRLSFIDTIVLMHLWAPVVMGVLVLIWFFFFKDVSGSFFQIMEGGVKNILLFAGKLITAVTLFNISSRLIIYIENKFKIEECSFTVKLLMVALNLVTTISIFIASIYFDLNFFSVLIDMNFKG